MTRAKCHDCEGKRSFGEFEDPRIPPLDEGPCLCEDCYRLAVAEVLETACGEVEDLARAAIGAIGRRKVREALSPLSAFLQREDIS